MKTKEFDVEKELERISKKMGNDETLFAIYVNDGRKRLGVLTTGENDKDIICTIAAILETSLTSKGDEGMDRVTNIIIEALKLVQGSPAGLRLSTEMLKGIIEKAELSLVENGDDDNEEDCENCEFMRTCQNERAIAYRKANRIPKPKNGKGRKVEVN